MAFVKRLGRFAFIFLLISILLGFKVTDKKSYRSKSYVELSDEVMYAFIKEVAVEFGFRCESIGGSMPYDVESMHIGFIAYRKATIDEARELEVALIEKLLGIVNSHEKIRPYLREYPFTSDRANVSISFYDKDNEYETESISYVSQAKNKIFYSVNDPKTDSLVDFADESYEDAHEIVQNNLPNTSPPL